MTYGALTRGKKKWTYVLINCTKSMNSFLIFRKESSYHCKRLNERKKSMVNRRLSFIANDKKIGIWRTRVYRKINRYQNEKRISFFTSSRKYTENFSFFFLLKKIGVIRMSLLTD